MRVRLSTIARAMECPTVCFARAGESFVGVGADDCERAFLRLRARIGCGYGAVRCGRSVGVALMWMDTFQVGKDYLTVKGVPMLIASVLDHSIRDSFLVFTGELGSATRTLLSETHRAEV